MFTRNNYYLFIIIIIVYFRLLLYNNNNNITIYKAHNVRKKLNLRRRQFHPIYRAVCYPVPGTEGEAAMRGFLLTFNC